MKKQQLRLRSGALFRKDGSRRSPGSVARILWHEPEPISTRIFLSALLAGRTREAACHEAGINPRAVEHWLKAASTPEAKPSHITFRNDYMQALTTRNQDVAKREAQLPADIALLGTPERLERILSYMQGGTYPSVAAEACGVPASVFLDWVEEGRVDPTSAYRHLYFGFLAAQATARASAEQRVYEDNPLAWLLHGPGRERPESPGWTRETRLTGAQGGPVTIITTQWGNAAQRTVDSSLEDKPKT